MLTTVKRATKARARTDEAWKQAIRDAHAAGHSLRVIGDAAGVSHVRVLKILRGE